MLRRRSSVFTLVVLVAVISFISCKGQEPSQREVPSGGAALPGVEAAVQANLALLRSEDPADRSAAAFRLARMGPMARSAVPALIDAVRDSHTVVRKNVISALQEMGPDARSAVPSLRGLLEDSDENIRLRATLALRRIERDDRVQEAVERLEHSDETVRLEAVWDLLRETPDTREAVPSLIAVLKDGNPEIRLAAVKSLSTMAFVGPSSDPTSNWAVIEALNQAVDDANPVVRAEAISVLGIVRAVMNSLEPAVQGDVDGTIEQLTQILRLVPDEVGAHLRLGSAYALKDNHDAAIASFDKVLELVPRYAPAYRERGVVLARKGFTEDALTDLNRALFLNENMVKVFRDRARLYASRQEYGLALEDLGTCLRLDPDSLAHKEAHILRAHIYFVTDSYERCLEEVNRALEIGGPSAVAYYLKALASEKLGQRQEAEEAYRTFAETPLRPIDLSFGVKEAWLATRQQLGYPPESTRDR